jgi:hypothetical protein
MKCPSTRQIRRNDRGMVFPARSVRQASDLNLLTDEMSISYADPKDNWHGYSMPACRKAALRHAGMCPLKINY